MPYQSSTFDILCGVCSEDNVHYDIRVQEVCGGSVRSAMTTRSGNSLPAVSWNDFNFYNCCQGTLSVSGTVGPGGNQVTLFLEGSNIFPCSGVDPSDYQPGSFVAQVTVDLSLSGNCPNDLPNV